MKALIKNGKRKQDIWAKSMKKWAEALGELTKTMKKHHELMQQLKANSIVYPAPSPIYNPKRNRVKSYHR